MLAKDSFRKLPATNHTHQSNPTRAAMSKLIFTLSDLNFLGSERSHFREKTIVGKELAQPLPKNKKPALLRSERAFLLATWQLRKTACDLGFGVFRRRRKLKFSQDLRNSRRWEHTLCCHAGQQVLDSPRRKGDHLNYGWELKETSHNCNYCPQPSTCFWSLLSGLQG